MLNWNSSTEGFSIGLDGEPILTHGPGRPCASFGRSSISILMEHGMYRIREESVLWRKEASEFRVVEEGRAALLVEFPGLFRLRITESKNAVEIVPEIVSEAEPNFFSLTVCLPGGDAIFGGGEQFSHVDLRGKALPMWVSEAGVGRGPNLVKILADIHSGRGGSREHTYFPQPSFVTSSGRWGLVSANAFSRMDFKKRGRCTCEVYAVPEFICLGKAENCGEAAARIGGILGIQPPPPDWIYDGLVLGAQGGSAVVSAKLEKALGAGIPVSALWCQDWQGVRMTPYGKQLFWNWDYDRSLYPDLPDFISGLHGRGVKFLGYCNPFLSSDAPLYAEAAEKGRFVKNRGGAPYTTFTTTFPVAPLDLFDGEAREWFKSVIKKNMIGVGLDGWMADFGEYFPPDGVSSCGADTYAAHNRYPVEWAALNGEAIREAGKSGEVVFFCRSGFSGATRYAPLFWAGDQAVDFMADFGLPAAVAAGISSAMSAVGYWHFDIGGFFSYGWIRRSKELLLRSCEAAAFTQVMRTHEGINPKVNAQFDSDLGSLAHFARMTRIHVALGPYHRELSRRYQDEGVPPIGPVVLEGRARRRELGAGLPSARARTTATEFMYGPDLLVAPILAKGAKSRKVELPEGEWIDFWTGRTAGRGVQSVPAPIGYPPVFIRAGSSFWELFRRAAAAE